MNAEYGNAREWVINPPLGEVLVPPEVDFVYIMREDGQHAMTPIAKRLANESDGDEGYNTQALLDAYQMFFGRLASALHTAFAAKGNVQLHLFDAETLEEAVRAMAGSSQVVSLDPLLEQDVLSFCVSRGYYPGGIQDFGQVARPDSLPLEDQAVAIAVALSGMPAVVAEDDLFSGGSVRASLRWLVSRAAKIVKLVAGIRVGQPDIGIPIEAAVTYKTTDGADIFDKVDLGDPRDFLLGASGLVVKLPSGQLGRAPYILPFVSTAARAGIPTEFEREFALQLLETNLQFYVEAEQAVGMPICLRHVDPGFARLMVEVFDFDVNTPMSVVVAWAAENIDEVWAYTQSLGRQQAAIESK